MLKARRTSMLIQGIAYNVTNRNPKGTGISRARIKDFIRNPVAAKPSFFRDPAVRLNEAELKAQGSMHNVPLCIDHDRSAVAGRTLHTFVDDEGNLIIQASVEGGTKAGDLALALLERGHLTGLSVSYKITLGDDENSIPRKRIDEISLVSKPEFPGCGITVMASDNASPRYYINMPVHVMPDEEGCPADRMICDFFRSLDPLPTEISVRASGDDEPTHPKHSCSPAMNTAPAPISVPTPSAPAVAATPVAPVAAATPATAVSVPVAPVVAPVAGATATPAATPAVPQSTLTYETLPGDPNKFVEEPKMLEHLGTLDVPALSRWILTLMSASKNAQLGHTTKIDELSKAKAAADTELASYKSKEKDSRTGNFKNMEIAVAASSGEKLDPVVRAQIEQSLEKGDNELLNKLVAYVGQIRAPTTLQIQASAGPPVAAAPQPAPGELFLMGARDMLFPQGRGQKRPVELQIAASAGAPVQPAPKKPATIEELFQQRFGIPMPGGDPDTRLGTTMRHMPSAPGSGGL